MGGRGRDSGRGPRQLTIDDAQRQLRVFETIKEYEQKRSEMEGAGGGVGGVGDTPILMKKCVCCGEYTIPTDSTHFECPICGWIDDTFQNNNPDSLNGKNPISLNSARARYNEIKASSN